MGHAVEQHEQWSRWWIRWRRVWWFWRVGWWRGVGWIRWREERGRRGVGGFLDMRRHYQVLWGEDVLKTLEIPMRLHRAQVEYELREKTILLRQRLLVVSGNDEAKWELLLRSLPAFGTLFRHALIALDDAGAGSKREAAAALAGKRGVDASVFGELLNIRERKTDQKAVKVDEIFARYLTLVEQVT